MPVNFYPYTLDQETQDVPSETEEQVSSKGVVDYRNDLEDTPKAIPQMTDFASAMQEVMYSQQSQMEAVSQIAEDIAASPADRDPPADKLIAGSYESNKVYLRSIVRMSRTAKCIEVAGISLWGDLELLLCERIIGITPENISEQRYETVPLIAWFLDKVAIFLQESFNKAGLTTDIDAHAQQTISEPLSKEALDIFFVDPIYELASSVVGHDMSFQDNPVLKFVASGAFKSSKAVVLAEVLNLLEQMEEEVVVVSRTYSGPALAVTYV